MSKDGYNGYKRKLVAILSADAQDYSRLMGDDEAGTVRTRNSHFQAISERIGKYRGRVVDTSGDGLLAEFPSVVDAVQCAAEIQETLKLRNEELPEGRRMAFRIGINLGDVIEEEGRISGDGVNAAARIQQLADGDEIFISGTAYDQVRNKLPFGYEYEGEKAVKNIYDPVRVYRVVPSGTGPRTWRAKWNRAGRWKSFMMAAVPGVVVAATTTGLWIMYFRPAPPPMEPVAQKPVSAPFIEPAKVGPEDRKLEPRKAAPRKPKTGPGDPVPRVAPDKPPGPPVPDEPSIAVLPFENMSGDPEQTYICDGFTDDIITTLSHLPRLFVISRSSTSVYKKKPATVKEVSRELGVRYVLEGSIQRSGNRMRVNAQLLDGTTGKHVWAERYDRDVGDLFRTKDELLLDIAAALVGKLTDGDAAKIARRNTESLKAWEVFQRGQVFYERYTPEDNLRARELFRKTTELDPHYVNAWMMVGWTYYIEGRDGKEEVRDQAFEKAFEIVGKVREIDPSYYGSYFLIAALQGRKGLHDEAVSNSRKAVEMEPSNAYTVAALARDLNYVGQPEEAIVLFQRAMRLSPYYRPWYLDGLGLSYHMAGRHDQAIETFKKSIKRAPNSVWPHLRLAVIHAEQGREEEMRAEAAEVLRINPKFSVETWAKVQSFKDPKIHEYRKALMIKAGLPE